MAEGHENSTERNIAALERFVVENPDLELLEDLLSEFNIFEAVGAVRQELRHSDFLAFLLNPSSPHGLGDLFLTRLLKQCVLFTPTDENRVLSPIDLDVWTMDDLVVLREWQNIDILLVDDEHRLVIAIENKIASGEQAGQLSRYRETIKSSYPGWTHVFLFLTPEEDQPSDEAYIPIGYPLIAETIESIVESRSSVLGQDVQSTLRHYVEMLRRHIVTESEIAELCRRIYRRHQRALDLIYEHRPDVQAQIYEFLLNTISDHPVITPDHSSKSYIRFIPEDWDFPGLSVGEGWTNTGRILLFEFTNSPDSLRLKLIIGPGPNEVRHRLFEMALSNQPPFRTGKSLNKMWNTVFVRPILSTSDYEGSTFEELAELINKTWRRFENHDLPSLHEVIEAQEWLH